MILLGTACWFGFVHYQRAERCRNAREVFIQKVESLTREADHQLVPGTKKDVLVQFFADHGIFLEFDSVGDHPVASGVLKAPALPECVASGCSAGSAQIRVQVAVDEAGTVTDHPFVAATGTNCL
jgi:hypothetical protein